MFHLPSRAIFNMHTLTQPRCLSFNIMTPYVKMTFFKDIRTGGGMCAETSSQGMHFASLQDAYALHF